MEKRRKKGILHRIIVQNVKSQFVVSTLRLICYIYEVYNVSYRLRLKEKSALSTKGLTYNSCIP